MGNILNQEDFVGAGFKRLDATSIEQHPPKIKWGQLYRDMSTDAKIKYLERLASAMNHAAATIQGERDDLNELMKKKERQLISMSQAIAQNNAMLQSEMLRMNEDKQKMLKEMTLMRTKLRELTQ